MGCSSSKPSINYVAQGTGSSRAQDQAVSLEQIATQLLHRYTKPESIWTALETGHVRLVKATYLIQLADEKGTLRRRQELPESAFIGVDELKALLRQMQAAPGAPVAAASVSAIAVLRRNPKALPAMPVSPFQGSRTLARDRRPRNAAALHGTVRDTPFRPAARHSRAHRHFPARRCKSRLLQPHDLPLSACPWTSF